LDLHEGLDFFFQSKRLEAFFFPRLWHRTSE
jgi:hypothetical protein